VGVLDVNAIEAQQRKTDRKGARRPVVVAGDFNDWRQQANQPLKAQAGLEEIFTRARGRPHRQLRLPLVGTQSEMDANDVNRNAALRRYDAAVPIPCPPASRWWWPEILTTGVSRLTSR
jgi:endonuclease/exonuclease/phosphatase family metal-dependent hydrolase